ncbi:nitric oxide synthase oxygenase [Rubritalea tangerina]|uniref:Nitric oxide synthase oxygenase n=1 Tax=Rubritalea tangerina TaxID=430798 RepID=A0ABW4ZDJ9_9BACT
MLKAAHKFLDQLCSEGLTIPSSRYLQVRQEIAAHGHYKLLPDELLWAARLAWRNSEKCIGRLHWKNLQIIDGQSASSAQEVFQLCVEHLRRSTNGGRIQPMVSFFPPEKNHQSVRIHNPQLIRYAGYPQKDGSTIGDPEQIPLTQQAINLGWKPPASPSHFDPLPLIISYPGEPTQYFEIPHDAILEVPMRHRDFPWFADLGLKWHALPAVSDRVLEAGGLRFTAAPFSGYYMGTEIGARNFGDRNRYNMLPSVAKKMGLDTSKSDSLWRDRAILELNSAVLFSFRANGVTIVDHHTASRQFIKHIANEEKLGREVPGNWSWLVPPISGSTTDVFHRGYSKAKLCPFFNKQ